MGFKRACSGARRGSSSRFRPFPRRMHPILRKSIFCGIALVRPTTTVASITQSRSVPKEAPELTRFECYTT